MLNTLGSRQDSKENAEHPQGTEMGPILGSTFKVLFSFNQQFWMDT